MAQERLCDIKLVVSNRLRTKRAHYNIGGATMSFAALVKTLHRVPFTKNVFTKLEEMVREGSEHNLGKVQKVFGPRVNQGLTLYVIVTDRFTDVHRRRQQDS